MIRRPPRSTRTTHSFPTRRSSDLVRVRGDVLGSFVGGAQAGEGAPRPERAHQGGLRGKFVTVSYIWGGHGLRPLLMGSRDRRRGPFLVLEGDRKSTRLNSSH